ncbi:MAG: ABC transporter substrate-binding protein [Ruminococcus sp.]|nr:ABC transporter substrate-binding protein [Ruminococcus sp.]
MRAAAFLTAALMLFTAVSCGSAPVVSSGTGTVMTKTGSMELEYADQFSVDYLDSGCSLITIGEDRFLLVPEGQAVPENTENAAVIRQPVENIYLAASSAMDLFSGLDELDKVKMTSTDLKSWTLPEVQTALETGSMEYIGKYSAPDYERLVAEDCGIAIESTMIYHSPQVREKLESLGIPVIVERSSYEAHPLGRMEWIKLYGLLLGEAEAAQTFFDEKTSGFSRLDISDIPEDERKTAAFFYISSNGYVNIRKPGDYVSQMIALAGGRYIFTADELDVDDNALSTMNIQLEAFYDIARDADFLIYNSTIEGELDSVEQLIEKSGIFEDFKAVREGNVWCTGQNMFQQTTGAADMITDLSLIFSGEAEDTEQLTFLHRLS